MNKLFGAKVKHKRKLLGLSLQALADKINRSKGYIYQIEVDKSDPFLSVIKDLSRVLEVPVGYLVDDNYNIGTYPHDPHYCRYCERIEKIKHIIN